MAILFILQCGLKEDGFFIRGTLIVMQDDFVNLQLRFPGELPGQLRTGEALGALQIEIREIPQDTRHENAVAAGEGLRPIKALVLCCILRGTHQIGEVGSSEVLPRKSLDLAPDCKIRDAADHQHPGGHTEKNVKTCHTSHLPEMLSV